MWLPVCGTLVVPQLIGMFKTKKGEAMASPNDLVLPKVPANNEIKFLSEYVRFYIKRSQELGFSAVEAAYNANAPAEDLDTIQNWGDAEAVVFMTLHQRMYWGGPYDA